MDYLDFSVRFGARLGDAYPVTVELPDRAPANCMVPAFDDRDLTIYQQRLQIAIRDSDPVRGQGRFKPTLIEKPALDFGRMLFSAVFRDAVKDSYNVARAVSEQTERGLRIRLSIEAPELAALPWEFLYDPDYGDYLCLAGRTALVRYVEGQRPVPLAVEPPLRILGVAVSPEAEGYATLDVEAERTHVEQALVPLRDRGLVHLEWLPRQTVRDLMSAIRRGTWHVLHFIGHGDFDAPSEEGGIILLDENARPQRLGAHQLGRIVAGRSTVRLVVLNACEGARGSSADIFSSTAATLVRRDVPAVLAMQYRISDTAAIEFARQFYTAVADGLAVDAAVTEGRIGINVSAASTLEWGSPVLYMQSPAGMLFDVKRLTGTSVVAPPTPHGPTPPETQAPAEIRPVARVDTEEPSAATPGGLYQAEEPQLAVNGGPAESPELQRSAGPLMAALFGTGLFVAGAIFPTVAALAVGGIYGGGFLVHQTPGQVAAYGTLAAAVLSLCIGLAVVRGFQLTSAEHANPRTYRAIRQRARDLEDEVRWRLESIAPGMPRHAASAMRRTCSFLNDLQHEMSQRGAHWITGTGYLTLWNLLHRAEEEHLLVAPPDAVTVAARAESRSLRRLGLAENTRLLANLETALALLEPGPMDGRPTASDASRDREARDSVREARHLLNRRHDRITGGVIRLRQLFVWIFFVAGLVSYVLAVNAVWSGMDPVLVERGSLLFLVGALTALGTRLIQEFWSEDGEDDLGVSLVQRLTVPLVAGTVGLLAAIVISHLRSGVEVDSGFENPILVRFEQPEMFLYAAVFALLTDVLLSLPRRWAHHRLNRPEADRWDRSPAMIGQDPQ